MRTLTIGQLAKQAGVVVAFGFAAGPDVTFDIRSLFFAQKKLRMSNAMDQQDRQSQRED